MVFNRLVALGAILTGVLAVVHPEEAYGEPPAVPGEYIVEFKPGRFPVAAARATAGEAPHRGGLPAGVAVQRSLGPNSAIVTASNSRLSAATTAAAAGARSDSSFCESLPKDSVAACSPNYIVSINRTPNDSLFGEQWGLAASGIDAARGWDIATSSSPIVVAVHDTGVAYNHPDLAANMWRNTGEVPHNGLDDDNNGVIDDIHGMNAIANNGDPFDDNSHGTHVAGTIGAVGNNGSGVVGVGWQAQIMALKFLDSNGSGTLANAIEAIEYVLVMKSRGVDIRVVNASWGGGGFSAPLYNAIGRLRDAGIVLVAAAGNEQNDNDLQSAYPASYDLDNIVSVAALTRAQNLANFSNFGATTVDIAAPGDDILSTVPGNAYATLSGTSMAAPHVSGALALLAAHLPGEAYGALIARLYGSGVDLPALAGITATGRALNLGRLMRDETTLIPPPPVSADGCVYDVMPTASGRDRSADTAPVVIRSDELSFARVDLPFQFPLHRETFSTITISPNGVVYMGAVEDRLDFLPGTSAPAYSVAALHTDLVTFGQGAGVRVATFSDRVTIHWVAYLYGWPDDVAEITLSLFADGTVRTSLDFATLSLESIARTNAVMGLRGGSNGSAVTYARGGSKIRDGLEVTYVRRCEGITTPRVTAINLTGSDGRRRLNRVTAGGRFEVDVRTDTADVVVPLGVVINGSACPINPRNIQLSGRSAKLRGSARLLRGRSKVARLGFFSAATVKERPVMHPDQRADKVKAKKISRNSLCRAIVRSLRPMP